MRYLYVSLFKSNIKFGSIIWRPYYKNNKNRLESIQHRALRFLAFKQGNPMGRFDHDYSKLAKI